MKNFAFDHNGQTLWFSRSIACSMYLFVRERLTGKWYVLVSKRGPGCPSAVGKWNVPGGYLDFDETLEDAAKRECFEETGVKVTEKVTLASISTDLKSKKQNVVCSFYAMREVSDISEIRSQFTYDHGENNEVDDIDLWEVDYFFNYPKTAAYDMAFGHDKMIREIFNKRINIGLVSKYIIDTADKITKIDLEIQ